MPPADLRIQIVNYRTKSYLVECLRTLSGCVEDPDLHCSIALLDNGSGDVLTDLPPMFPGWPLEIHQGEDNVGFGAGHNFLARLGEARFLLLLNPDARLLTPDTPRNLLRRAEELNVPVVGPRLVSDDGQTERWDHGEIEGWRARLTLRTGNSFWKDRAGSGPIPAAWVNGAALLIEKEWFDALGGFDEAFFLYKEDEELCWRVRERGGQVIHDPTESVYHRRGAVARKSEHLRASTDYFLHKHYRDRIGYGLLRLINRILH